MSSADFSIFRRFGRGAYGEVYVSRKEDTRTFFALKMVHTSRLVWTILSAKKVRVSSLRDTYTSPYAPRPKRRKMLKSAELTALGGTAARQRLAAANCERWKPAAHLKTHA